MKNINVVFFSLFSLILLLLSFFTESSFFFVELEKPWQLQPFTHEDSLCQLYKENYKQLGKTPILSAEIDASKSVVIILVDAWGVPLNSSLMDEDFAFLSSDRSVFSLHKRMINRNTHAEAVELRNNYNNSVYFFGGDSLEYKRNSYIPELGFRQAVFCQKCNDETMLAKLDSAIGLMSVDSSLTFPGMLAWTTQTSRDGNRKKLHETLASIARLIQKYPDIQFVVQGTHRPILGTPETRRMYHAHWVPVVIVK